MEKFVWKATVKEGMMDEYIKRHDEIWPEMTEALNGAGIVNYTIWNNDHELFGYYECESVEFAAKFQNESETVKKWNVFMKDILMFPVDENGEKLSYRCVFRHN